MESLPNSRLCQPQDGLGPFAACQNSFEWKYSPLKSRLHKDDGFWNSRHACFPKSALLNVSKSRNSSPPLSFRSLSRSQPFQRMPDLVQLFCHQNLAIFCSMDLHIEIGTLKIDMAYSGSACTTVFSKIFFPPLEIKSSFHPASFALTRPRIQANISFLKTPQLDGIPKYLPIFGSIGTLSSLVRFYFKLIGQFLLKNIPDLFLFTACLVAKQYCCKMFDRFWHSSNCPSKKNMASFAKNRWDSVGHHLLNLIPFRFPMPTACLIRVDKTLAKIMNM